MYCLELGGDDDAFAAAEAAVATDIDDEPTVVAPGLATTSTLDPDRVRALAYTHRASRVVAESDAELDAATAALQTADLDVPTASPDGRTSPEGTTSPEGSTTTIAVRARDVRNTTRVDTQRAERALGSVLVERGFAVDLDDPDYELRACFSDDSCIIGWLVAESIRDFGDRKPTDRPFFQPGSMDPLLARALVNLARVESGDRLLDPMCGTGGVCIEAGLVGATPLGTDAQTKMARGARENLQHFLGPDPVGDLAAESHAPFHVARADATSLPLPDDAVDAVVFDAPYGRQSKIETHELADLVGGALAEARRVVPDGGRAVVVADRDWRDEARAPGWIVEDRFVRRVHRSLDRHVLVLG